MIEIPDNLYHLSPMKNTDSIKRYGLHPKSKNKNSTHPDRIYLFDNINNLDKLLDELKYNDKKKSIDGKYFLIKIDTNQIYLKQKLKDRIILHTDSNYLQGYYSYDFFHPTVLEIIKQNL